MNDKERKLQTSAVLAMVESLQNSVIGAGGVPITLQQMREWTVVDLIANLVTNGIRFTYRDDPRS